MFIGVPCTTNMGHGSYAFALHILEWSFMLNFSQVKSMSSKRLLRRMANVHSNVQREIRTKFITYINRKPAG